jgi:hypothetical protein
VSLIGTARERIVTRGRSTLVVRRACVAVYDERQATQRDKRSCNENTVEKRRVAYSTPRRWHLALPTS